MYLEILNNPQNLVTLCVNCHMKIEWHEDLNLELKDIVKNTYPNTTEGNINNG